MKSAPQKLFQICVSAPKIRGTYLLATGIFTQTPYMCIIWPEVILPSLPPCLSGLEAKTPASLYVYLLVKGYIT